MIVIWLKFSAFSSATLHHHTPQRQKWHSRRPPSRNALIPQAFSAAHLVGMYLDKLKLDDAAASELKTGVVEVVMPSPAGALMSSVAPFSTPPPSLVSMASALFDGCRSRLRYHQIGSEK